MLSESLLLYSLCSGCPAGPFHTTDCKHMQNHNALWGEANEMWLLEAVVTRRCHRPHTLLCSNWAWTPGFEVRHLSLTDNMKGFVLQMGGPQGVLAVERYALVTAPAGGLAMHAIPRQPPAPAEH